MRPSIRTACGSVSQSGTSSTSRPRSTLNGMDARVSAMIDVHRDTAGMHAYRL